MTIVSPYRSGDVEILIECNLSQEDKVERSGYIRPEVKIKSYLETGQLLQNYRPGGAEYDIQGEETDLDEDSPEFADELTEDAENFTQSPLPQFIDKMSAVETLNEFEQTFEQHSSEAEAKTKKATAEENERKKSLKELGDTIAKSVVNAQGSAKSDT